MTCAIDWPTPRKKPCKRRKRTSGQPLDVDAGAAGRLILSVNVFGHPVGRGDKISVYPRKSAIDILQLHDAFDAVDGPGMACGDQPSAQLAV